MTRTIKQCIPGVSVALTVALGLMQPRLASAADPVEKLQEFALDQVQITDPYQQNLFAKNVAFLITTLNSDRLLAGFKAVSAGTTATNLYGGWESQNIRGHSWATGCRRSRTLISKRRGVIPPWRVRSRPSSTTSFRS